MLASQRYFLQNIPMSFNVWNFTFNELCDLKNLKKLISGSCPIPIIQSCINNLKYIYIWAWSTQNSMWSAYFFVNLFRIVQLFIIFRKWQHLILASFYTHVCPSQLFFSLFSKIKKPKIPFWRGRIDVWAVHFYKIFGCLFFTLQIFLWATLKLLSGFLSVSFRSN